MRFQYHPTLHLFPIGSPRKFTKGEHRHHDQHRRIAIHQQSPLRKWETHGSVVGICATFLALSSIVTTTVLAVTTRSAVSALTTTSAFTVSTESRGSACGTSGFHVGLRNDFRRQVKPFAEVGETLVGQSVVVPLPRELCLDVSLGSQGLHGLDDFQVADTGDVGVRRAVKVLGGDENTILEESLVDLLLAVA